jgi:hypothetical protein
MSRCNKDADRLREDGAFIRRVVLDHELKREYQQFLQERNRGKSESDGRPDRTPEEIHRWAVEHELPNNDGHVQFPDARLEYEDRDGMVLDAILENPESIWMSLSTEKLGYLASRGISADDAPHLSIRQGDQRRVRHFPDRLPIGVHPSGHVVVVYLHADPMHDEFRNFLHRHAPPLEKLPAWTIRIVVPPHLEGAVNVTVDLTQRKRNEVLAIGRAGFGLGSSEIQTATVPLLARDRRWLRKRRHRAPPVDVWDAVNRDDLLSVTSLKHYIRARRHTRVRARRDRQLRSTIRAWRVGRSDYDPKSVRR